MLCQEKTHFKSILPILPRRVVKYQTRIMPEACWSLQSFSLRFLDLEKVAIIVLIMFGLTYTCESSFSHMNAIKNAALVAPWLTGLFTNAFELNWHEPKVTPLILSKRLLPLRKSAGYLYPTYHYNVGCVAKPCITTCGDLQSTYDPSVYSRHCVCVFFLFLK